MRFTNVVCENLDPTFCIFERCKLIAVSRDANYLTLKAVLLQVPVTDFELRIQIMKKANGWKPFLYDLTVKCNFTKKLNTITRLLWKTVKIFSNIKTDCPYNQNLETINLSNAIIEEAFNRLPVQQGEYAFFTTWKAYNLTRVKLNFYGVFY
ncbi:uncharacterized protein LOC135958478 [Calliphora vicina]|uniref:uncharacterized protein LOC135958478 n=1 Tax=Calliphora vicina TaxID=7373 RepID=UPI00325A82B4